MRFFLSLSLLAFHLSIPLEGKAPLREELSRKAAKAQSAIAFLSPFFAPSSGDLCANYFLSQRRKGGKQTLGNAAALCDFATLRLCVRNIFSDRGRAF